MEDSKIHLSNAERELMQNADVILTKNRVLEKMKLMLEEVQLRQLAFTHQNNLSAKAPYIISPKISRGENYLGLPWLILDYPRMSGGDDLFFIRTMFWWGRFFSTTLHLAGSYKKELEERIGQSYEPLKDFSIGINDDPWAHHFEKDNYWHIGSMEAETFNELCRSRQHLKLAITWPLLKWEEASKNLYQRWEFLVGLSDQLPRR